MPGEAHIRKFEAHLVGFDISGFSRFAEAWVGRGEGFGVDDLARIWERAAAPQIDRLIGSGYRVADLCGDGVVAYRTEPVEDDATQRLLDGIERDFAAVAPGLSLRTARVSGELALVGIEVLGRAHAWATGPAIEALHRRLDAIRRAPAGELSPDRLAAGSEDEALVFQWSRTGAEVRAVVSLFIRFAPEPWIWSDAPRIAHAVGRVAACAAANEGLVEKVTHDDKGLLFRCAFSDGHNDSVVAAARAGRMILAADLGQDVGVAVSEGLAYRGPLRVGPDSLVTLHGPAVNRAGKACAGARGLVVLAEADEVRAARLRALGLEPGGGDLWTGPAATAPEAATTDDEPVEIFVGREAQLARLEGLLPGAAIQACAIVIEGVAGQGKTMLVRRFASTLPPGWRVATAQAAPVDGLRGPWPRLLSQLVRQVFDEDRDALAHALAGAGLAESDLGLLPHLGVLGFFSDPGGDSLEPFALRERLDELFSALIRITSGQVALVVEDGHWLTPEAVRWLELCHAAEGGRLLIVTRREDQPGAPPILPQTPRLRLPPLSAADSHGLIRIRRPDLAPHAAARSTITMIARGSPLLLEQLARAWPQSNGADFEWFGGQVAGSEDAGASVLIRVLDARLDRLKPAETEVLRRLAVEGRPRRPEVVDPGNAAAFAQQARRLVRAGLVSVDDAGRLAPRHALVGEAVRQRTPGLILRVMHARAARRIARDAQAEPELVGAHWREARAPARAAMWLARAARAAEAGGAIRGAVDLYQQALDACPVAAHGRRAALVWRSRLAAAAFGIGELARARREAGRCTAAAPERRLAEARRRALLVSTEIATFTADLPAAMRSLAELRRMGATATEGLAGREAALWGYGLSILRARPLARGLLNRAAAVGPRDRYYVEASRGLIHTCFGEWDAAEAALAEAMALAPPERLPHENEIAATLLALGLYLHGRAGESLTLFDAILKSGRGRDNAMHEAWGLYGGAQALITLDRKEEAEARLSRAEVLLDGHIDRQSQLICSGLRVALAERRGDVALLLSTMDANRAIADAMAASNFGSFEGYAARPTAALRTLLAGGVPSKARERLLEHAQSGMRALGRYALLFPIGRPRLGCCRALQAAYLGRPKVARTRLNRALLAAQNLRMPNEMAFASIHGLNLLDPTPVTS